MTQSESVIDCMKLEENDNQSQVQAQIWIENPEKTCVKLEEIEIENNAGNNLDSNLGHFFLIQLIVINLLIYSFLDDP